MPDPNHYELFRSTSSDRADLVVRAGTLDRVPSLVIDGGPWLLVKRGDIDRLKPAIIEDIAEHGYHLDATPNEFDPQV